MDTYKGIYFCTDKPTNIEFTEKWAEATDFVIFDVDVDKTLRAF